MRLRIANPSSVAIPRLTSFSRSFRSSAPPLNRHGPMSTNFKTSNPLSPNGQKTSWLTFPPSFLKTDSTYCPRCSSMIHSNVSPAKKLWSTHTSTPSTRQNSRVMNHPNDHRVYFIYPIWLMTQGENNSIFISCHYIRFKSIKLQENLLQLQMQKSRIFNI